LLYERRKQAVMLYQRSMTRREIAPIVGASPYMEGQWIKAWEKGGRGALKVRRFSPQKPIRRAYERNNERVRVWLREEYPPIAAKAKKENAGIHWRDETGLRSDDVNGRSYALKGIRRFRG